jgi:hypothetical protein
VPGDDGLRLDDDERRSPPGPDAGEPDPEPPVGLREPHPSRSGACITCSWCRKASTSAFGARTRRCSERQEGTRRAPIEWLESVSIVARNINYCKKNGVFTRHRSVRAGVTTTRAEKRRMSVGTAPLGLPLPGLSPARSGGLTTNSRPTGSTIRQALMSAKSSVALAFIVLSFSSGL